jgi:hypothetical protein
MNKIEEILEAQNLAIPVEYLQGSVRMGKTCRNDYKKILDAMVEFGKICFEAGHSFKIAPEENDRIYLVYNNYEDFLKEIENEKCDI